MSSYSLDEDWKLSGIESLRKCDISENMKISEQNWIMQSKIQNEIINNEKLNNNWGEHLWNSLKLKTNSIVKFAINLFETDKELVELN